MTEERRALHAYLTPEGHAGWQEFADENGVSISGLLEALGTVLHEEMAEAGGADIRQPWVKAGRKIDALRRRRGGQQ